MARKHDVKRALGGLLSEQAADTEIPPEAQMETSGEIPATGYTRSISVGLKASEIAALDDIAAAEGVKRNAVMRYLLRWAMAEYQAGRLAIPTSETRTKRVDMP